MEPEVVLAELEGLTRRHLAQAEVLLEKPEEVLQAKASPAAWSALECVEHLNRYGDFYLPEIDRRISSARPDSGQVFKSGWLGRYFAESMKPKPKLNKMRTFRNMDPANCSLDKNVILRFIDQQHRMLELLRRARSVDIGRVRTSISITPLITLKLGDTLQVVIYHNERHLQQAQRAVDGIPSKSS